MSKLISAGLMLASIIIAIWWVFDTIDYRRRVKPLEERLEESRRRLYGKKEDAQ